MKEKRLCLTSLRLLNYATFPDEEIKFQKGFNAIIGETGSGKSLVLDALQLVFGMRADKKAIRKGAEFAVIEATFEDIDNEVRHYLESINYPSDGNEIVLKRIVYATGTSKAFLNFQQCSLQTLTDFSRRFTDLVGQFENQKLLSESYQLKLLDTYARHNALVSDYSKGHQKLTSINEQIELLCDKKETLAQKKDYLLFQIKELDELSPSPEDEELLLRKKEQCLLRQNHQEALSSVLNSLCDREDYNVLDTLKKVCRELEKLPGKEMEAIYKKVHEAYLLLQDGAFELQTTGNAADDSEDLEDCLDRLDKYQKLKRKFHLETYQLVELHERFANEILEIEQADTTLKRLITERDQLNRELTLLAKSLHRSREVAALKLSKELTKSVHSLMMKGATLKFQTELTESLTKSGLTKINFLAETNPGEGFFKVKEIASGGELSRILLSLRQILSSNDTVSIFLFDEIDTGVGGETATSIGKALFNVASNSQVIAITHLPQIANCADCLLVVQKDTILEGKKERTISSTQILQATDKDNFVRDMASLH